MTTKPDKNTLTQSVARARGLATQTWEDIGFDPTKKVVLFTNLDDPSGSIVDYYATIAAASAVADTMTPRPIIDVNPKGATL